MSFIDPRSMHPQFQAARDQGSVAPNMLLPVWMGLAPIVIMLEPHIDFDVFWGIVNANASRGVVAVFTALESGASQVIVSPAFEAQIFAVGCRVASNLWTHLATPAPAAPAAPAAPSA